jgi:hypothetical protein
MWLDPSCYVEDYAGRCWHQEDPGACIDCDRSSVAYVRADLIRAHLAALSAQGEAERTGTGREEARQAAEATLAAMAQAVGWEGAA